MTRVKYRADSNECRERESERVGVSQIELIFKDGEEQSKMEQRRCRVDDGQREWQKETL